MTTKIFVGNLPFQVTDLELEDLFRNYGDVISAKVIVDRRTGRSKGYGFVEMNAEDMAKQAVTGLNGTSVSGRPINVSFARSQAEERSDRGGGGEFRQKRSYFSDY